MTVVAVGFDESYAKQITCNKCGTILQYRPQDVTHGKHTDISGCTEAYNYILCCSCCYQVEVSS